MNTSSHVLMGKFLYTYVKRKFGIYLERDSFIYGNVLPDISLSFLKRPHILEQNISYVRKEIQNLMERKQESAFIGKNYSKQLGIVCHYYADFFCFAHSKDFPANMISHIKYEFLLHQYFEENYFTVSRTDLTLANEINIDADLVYQKFNQLHFDYLQNNPSYYNDLTHCILACAEAIALITNSSIFQKSEESHLSGDHLKAI